MAGRTVDSTAHQKPRFFFAANPAPKQPTSPVGATKSLSDACPKQDPGPAHLQPPGFLQLVAPALPQPPSPFFPLQPPSQWRCRKKRLAAWLPLPRLRESSSPLYLDETHFRSLENLIPFAASSKPSFLLESLSSLCLCATAV